MAVPSTPLVIREPVRRFNMSDMLRVMISVTLRTARITALLCLWILRILLVLLKVCAQVAEESLRL